MVAPDAPDLAAEAARDYAASLMVLDEALRRAAAAAERYAPHLAGQPAKWCQVLKFSSLFRGQADALVAVAGFTIGGLKGEGSA